MIEKRDNMKGQTLSIIIEAVVGIFIAVLLAIVLGPVLSQINPSQTWIFYLGVVAVIIAAIISVVLGVRGR